MFLKQQAPGLAEGSITMTFRTWSRAQAKVGGRYRTWGLLLEVDAVDVVEAASITDAEAVAAGEATADALRARLGVAANDSVWRLAFRCLGDDDRIGLRSDDTMDDEQRGAIQARLNRLDRASKTGPWTARTLQLIATYPGVVSTALARHLDADRPAFKINVRKLKEMGLTESLEVGYRLSPRGRAFMGADEAGPA